MRRKGTVPSYRRQKRKGGLPPLAFVEVDGQRTYLGEYGTSESRQAYLQTVAEWKSGAGGDVGKAGDLTVMELAARFWTWAEAYYRRLDGSPTRELGNYRSTLKPLRVLYGETLAKDFGPLAFKAVRQVMVDSGACRHYVNQMGNRLRRVFRWAVAEELLPPSITEALRAVPALKRGRCEARETEAIRPVEPERIEAIRPHVSLEVWAVIQLQLLTAARSGELLALRPCDLDRSGPVWIATPLEHKTAYLGKGRALYFGPKAQVVIRPFLLGCSLEEYLFSPARAEARRRQEIRAARTTPLSCGNSTGTNRARQPKRRPRDRYDVGGYGHAIARACLKAKVDHWHPHQLRHSAATSLRREFGLDVARAILGHSSANVTGTYAELDREKALEVIARIG